MNSYQDLEGKVALVIGANGGMGLAISHALLDAGARVIASDISEAAGESLAGSKAVYQQVDVASEDSVTALIRTVMEQHGQLDCAINAAAIEFETSRMTDCDTADFDRMMAVNLRGTFLCMKHELKAMLAGETKGCIVNLASTTSFQAGQIQPAYTASKHGVLGLTRQAAVDYARDGIRVNGIAPGNIDTPMLRKALERRGLEADKVAPRMPLGRFGNAEEIAAAALWLCSDVSSFTTGHILTVEGGMLLS